VPTASGEVKQSLQAKGQPDLRAGLGGHWYAKLVEAVGYLEEQGYGEVTICFKEGDAYDVKVNFHIR